MPRARGRANLPTTSYAILGLLTFGEMSGYDLKGLADYSIADFFWSPARSQIYAELRRLTSLGFVTEVEVRQERRPDKRIYRLTSPGRRALRVWLELPDVAPDVFASGVVHHSVLCEFSTDSGVIRGFIGHQASFAPKVLANQRGDGVGLEIINDHAADLSAIAVNQRQNLVLVVVAASLLLALRLNGAIMADKSLVNLDGSAISAERGEVATAHRFSDPVAHEPCGLESDAQGAVQLVGADPLLARTNQKDRLQPDMQLDVAGLKNGADLNSEWLAARIALVGAYAGALALQLAALIDDPAMGAYAPVGPDPILDKLVCGFFVVEVGFSEDGHGFDPFRVPIR